MTQQEYDAEIERRFPFIKWREPIPISTPSRKGLGCRLCMARDGFRAQDGKLFKSAAEFADHMVKTHEQHGD
jgi:hypothetical protein